MGFNSGFKGLKIETVHGVR